MQLKLGLLAVLFVVAGCASLSEEDCKQGNWKEIGQKDGSRGYSKDRFSSHGKACEKYGIRPNKSEWTTGYNAGVKVYCSEEGKNLGEKGDLTTMPAACYGVSTFKQSRKVGFREFCFEEGIKAGRHADKLKGDARCTRYKRFSVGYEQGLGEYCTFEKAVKLGSNGMANMSFKCPKAKRGDFNEGWNQGIAKYCSRLNGFDLGKTSAAYNSKVCPSHLRTAFRNAYKKGQEYVNIKKKMNELDGKISEINTKMSKPETSADLKSYLYKELTQKKAEQDSLKAKLYKIEGYIEG